MPEKIYQKHQKQFEQLLDLYQEYNSHTNISAIREKEDIIEKHFLDSLYLYDFLNSKDLESKSLIDIGSGGGFPAIPLAIVFSQLKVTALDSVGKKTKFIELVKEKLQLENLSVIKDRAESLARSELRESFDFVCSRAVAELNVLLEYCMPLVKVNGIFIAYKKTGNETEINSACTALEILNGKITEVLTYKGEKQLIFITKMGKCLVEHPRETALIKNKPL